jgi:thiosulfate dehydrogenase [quinone] large subunit
VTHLAAGSVLASHVSGVKTIGLDGDHWLAVLRIGLGLWWLESWRHKDKKGWFQRGTGIAWAQDVASKHRWKFVTNSFNKFVAPHPKAMAYIVVYAELLIGLGLTFGFLTPIAAIGGILLGLQYFIVMIHDWAEQGQNLMMILIAFIVIVMLANQAWSIDAWLGILGG